MGGVRVYECFGILQAFGALAGAYKGAEAVLVKTSCGAVVLPPGSMAGKNSIELERFSQKL